MINVECIPLGLNALIPSMIYSRYMEGFNNEVKYHILNSISRCIPLLHINLSIAALQYMASQYHRSHTNYIEQLSSAPLAVNAIMRLKVSERDSIATMKKFI